jgi:U3 small nucleolar RNA-associated protein 11
MAQLKHFVAKKQHRERAQPLERRRWGLLEKKKDYQLRAQDFHRKEAHLKLLRKKASERNPDEYYHGMVSHKTDKKGILISDRGNEVLSNGAAKLLKTQDSRYVRTLTSTESKKIEKLESGLMFPSNGNHTVFVDSSDQARKFSVAEHFNTDPSLVDRRENRLTKDQLENEEFMTESKQLTEYDIKTMNKKKMSSYKELDQRNARKDELSKVQQQMDLQRELMKKGDKKKIVKNGIASWKWKSVRKK